MRFRQFVFAGNDVSRAGRTISLDSCRKAAATVWNIIFGVVFIVGGLSGKMAIRGTDSSNGLAVLGGVLLVWGIVQVVKSKQQE